ncbi:MAG: hypothetical protein ACI90R_000342 [Alteromonas macleodii]|jgi:hypothetical protein
MTTNLIFLPAIVQILLTMAVFIGLASAKSKAVKSGEVNEERRALHDDAWPDSVIKFNNNIRNQFELPVLFYVLCIILWAINCTNTLVHSFAWLFVASRIIHVAIHTGSNFIPLRRKVFMFGFFVLAALAVFAFVSIVAKYFALHF